MSNHHELSPAAWRAINALRYRQPLWDYQEIADEVRSSRGWEGGSDAVFEAIADLLLAIDRMDNSEVSDPDYDGPGDDSPQGPPDSPEIIARQDGDR